MFTSPFFQSFIERMQIHPHMRGHRHVLQKVHLLAQSPEHLGKVCLTI
jgi:hypothetical protein